MYVENTIDSLMYAPNDLSDAIRLTYASCHSSGASLYANSISNALFCDEPVSALDVSVQAQILNLIDNLKKKFHLTYIFISQDLGVIEHITNRVVVMYVGKIVEVSEPDSPFKDVKNSHPEALLSAVPVTHPTSKSKR